MSAYPMLDRNQETQIRFSHKASGRGTPQPQRPTALRASRQLRAKLERGPGHPRATLRALDRQ